MTSIKGFVDGMLDGTIPESECKHYLGVVSQETGRLARLVQNMLDITKLESGEVEERCSQKLRYLVHRYGCGAFG